MVSVDCDVAVLGGGMAGSAAALAAAETGAEVVLIERAGFLGGAATAGSVAQFVGWSTRAGRTVIAGMAAKIVNELRDMNGASAHGHFVMSTGNVMDRVEYDPDLLKIALDRILARAGVKVLFHSAFVAADMAADKVRSIRLAGPGGAVDIQAATFIDASGDMALLAAAGARFIDAEPTARQPATMMFAMAPVDFARLDAVSREEKDKIVRQGLASGALPRAALHYSRAPGSDVAWFNISRVVVDPTDPFSLSAGEVEGREQAARIAAFLKATLPGCENARLAQIAPSLGVRETRRVVGDHVLTVEELRRPAVFEDTIACGAYPVDIHHADGPKLTFEEFGEDHFYRIPYGALLPVGVGNVAAAGRGLSAEAEAFAAVRVMPSAMAVGHGAGAAAALAAASHGGDLRAVSVATLQAILRRQGAFLGN